MTITKLKEWLRENPPRGKAVLGFDAFVDQISRAVEGLGEGAIDSITMFGERLVARGERSGAVLLRDMEESIGGNAPNMARALGRLGVQTTLLSAVGYPHCRDVFEPLKACCKVMSYANPGGCLALELGGAKLFFSHNGELDGITWETLKARLGYEAILAEYDGASLIALLNWGEIAATRSLWNGLLEEVLPRVRPKSRVFFFDFSDLSGRSQAELELLCDQLRRFREFGRVYASANALESQILRSERLVSSGVVDVFIRHTGTESRLFTSKAQVALPVRHTDCPVKVTGGGDHFNAGFCYALLSGLEDEDCIKVGNATAGHMIRTGTPPSVEALFCELERSRALWDGEGLR